MFSANLDSIVCVFSFFLPHGTDFFFLNFCIFVVLHTTVNALKNIQI